MRRLLLTIVLAAGLAQGQEPQPEPRRGTNYDPPPRPVPKPEPPPPAPEPEKPFFQFQEVDWSSKSTWVKLALLIGSIVLARRAFRQMKGDY